MPLLDGAPERQLRYLTAGQLVAHQRPACLRRVERVRDVYHVLLTTAHNGFPVFDSAGPGGEQELVGLILRSQLLV